MKKPANELTGSRELVNRALEDADGGRLARYRQLVRQLAEGSELSATGGRELRQAAVGLGLSDEMVSLDVIAVQREEQLAERWAAKAAGLDEKKQAAQEANRRFAEAEREFAAARLARDVAIGAVTGVGEARAALRSHRLAHPRLFEPLPGDERGDE